MLPPTAGRLISAEVDEETRADPDWIKGNDNKLTLLLSRGFDENLERLNEAVTDPDEPDGHAPVSPDDYDETNAGNFARMLVDALLVDLASEQANVLAPRWRYGMSRQRMEDALERLGKLARFKPAQRELVPPDSGRRTRHPVAHRAPTPLGLDPMAILGVAALLLSACAAKLPAHA